MSSSSSADLFEKARNVFISSWKNRLTIYERARIISARALQLSMGAIPLIDVDPNKYQDPISIAEEELNRGVLPITVRRIFPNGEIQTISVRKLIKNS